MTTVTPVPDHIITVKSPGTPSSDSTAQARYAELVTYEAQDAARRLCDLGKPGIERLPHAGLSDADSFDKYEGFIHGWSLVRAIYLVDGDKKEYVTYILRDNGAIARRATADGPAWDVPVADIPMSVLSTMLFVLVRLG